MKILQWVTTNKNSIQNPCKNNTILVFMRERQKILSLRSTKVVEVNCLRDCSMRFLKLCFFHQSTPPGPIKGSLGRFLILATFHGAIQVLK